MLTPSDLARIAKAKEACEKATAGPWEYSVHADGHRYVSAADPMSPGDYETIVHMSPYDRSKARIDADGGFISVASVDFKWALDTILAMEEENRRMGEALRDASALLVSFAKDPDLKIDRRTKAGEVAKDGIAALAQREG